MAVIINEFEIVVEPSNQAESEPAHQQQQVVPAPRLSPRDLQLLLSYHQQRKQRVSAH